SPDGSPAKAVIFSLGNFISSQPYPWTYIGLILDLRLTIEADGRRVVGPIRLIPTYCHKGTRNGARLFEILPLDLAADYPERYGVAKSQAAKLAQNFQDISRHLLSMAPLSPPVRAAEASAMEAAAR
ncbi:MAG: hypothetical protein LBE49_06680, partial [Deltaproteobacteria bacterium]|nr:hypothetical protein [Deltaproteobacteria bacterium]